MLRATSGPTAAPGHSIVVPSQDWFTSYRLTSRALHDHDQLFSSATCTSSTLTWLTAAVPCQLMYPWFTSAPPL